MKEYTGCPRDIAQMLKALGLNLSTKNEKILRNFNTGKFWYIKKKFTPKRKKTMSRVKICHKYRWRVNSWVQTTEINLWLKTLRKSTKRSEQTNPTHAKEDTKKDCKTT